MCKDLNVLVAWQYRDELRQPLAEPHGDVSVHVDGEWLVALLQAADGEELQSAHVLPKVHPAHLTHAQTAHRDKTCLTAQGKVRYHDNINGTLSSPTVKRHI